MSNEAPPQTDQWPSVLRTRRGLSGVWVARRFVRLAASRRICLQEFFDIQASRLLCSAHKHNRGAAEARDPKAAIEASSLTRSDPELVLGTGLIVGHWPPETIDTTWECPRTPRLRLTGERGYLFLLFFSQKTRLICPSFSSYKTVSEAADILACQYGQGR